jgi:hypothetical protein
MTVTMTNYRTGTMPWLRRLVAGFPPRRPGFETGSFHVGFVVDKMVLGQVFSKYFGFPLSISFYRCSIEMEKTEKISSSSQGCTKSQKAVGASVASAAGPFTKKKLPD